MTNHQRDLSALQAIPAGMCRAQWVRVSMAAKAAGISFDDWHNWCRTGDNYDKASDCIAVWRSISTSGDIGAGTLFRMALEHGWVDDEPREPARRPAPMPLRTFRPWTDTAAYLWEQSRPLHGSLAEVYLKHRGCCLPPQDGDLRFLPGSAKYPNPVMLAKVTDVLSAEPISLHLTRLAEDGKGKAGTEQDKMLLAGHRKRGGVIRLWPDEAVTHGVAIAEGIESALCAAHAYTPVWAAIDAGNLSALPVLAGIEALTIVADHDPAGIKAAKECARRWATSGRQVRIALPRQSGADAADVVAA